MILEDHDGCSGWSSGRYGLHAGLFPSDCVIEKGTWDISFNFLVAKLIIGCYLMKCFIFRDRCYIFGSSCLIQSKLQL